MRIPKRKQLEHEVDLPISEQLACSLREVVQAMRDYEMDVDIDAPNTHRAMMQRAKLALSRVQND